MSVVSARSEWSTIIAKVKLSFGLRQSIHIEAVCIEIVCQIIGGKKIYGRRVTRFNTNFQQALDYFQWCKASHRISVRCHVSSAFLFNFGARSRFSCGRALLERTLGCTSAATSLFFIQQYSLAEVVAIFDAPAIPKVPK